jgi:serine protease Do
MEGDNMQKYKTIFVAVVTGAALGVLFMFVLLGIWQRENIPPIHPDPAVKDAVQNPVDSLKNISSRDFNDDLDLISDDLYVSRRNAIVRAAEKVGKAVVSLSVIQIVETRNSTPFGSDFWDFLFMPPPSRQRPVLSLGSGVIINPDGYVLTNDHVVGGAKEIRVTLTNGDEYIGRLIGSDPVTDLAVLKIISDSVVNFPYASMGDSDDIIIGEWAIAIGNPFGYLLDDTKPTVTVGVVSASERDIKPGRRQKAVYRNMIQTDASINPGNSGGPLVNALGEIIGINTFIFSSSRGSEGIGFAVPINRVKLVIDELLQYGEVAKTWIGITAHLNSPEIAERLKLNYNEGLVVTEVAKYSPAASAGINSGDILISVGNLDLKTLSDWGEISNYAISGRALAVNIVRDNTEIPIVVIPDEVPTRTVPFQTDMFGLVVSDISKEIASYMGIKNSNGVIIARAEENTIAHSWRLKEEDILRQIGNKKIKDANDYVNTMARIGHGYRIFFLVEREGELFFLQVFT